MRRDRGGGGGGGGGDLMDRFLSNFVLVVRFRCPALR